MITYKKLLLVLAAAGAITLGTNRCRGDYLEDNTTGSMLDSDDQDNHGRHDSWPSGDEQPSAPQEDAWALPPVGEDTGESSEGFPSEREGSGWEASSGE